MCVCVHVCVRVCVCVCMHALVCVCVCVCVCACVCACVCEHHVHCCVVLVQAYPEKFYYEGIQDLQMPIQHQYLPVYFGNVCLRFIPVSHSSDCFGLGIMGMVVMMDE